jgi:hypothetical protein
MISWDVEDFTRMRCLGYGKSFGKWGLLISEGFDDEPPGAGNVSFLREESRDVKLEAVGTLLSPQCERERGRDGRGEVGTAAGSSFVLLGNDAQVLRYNSNGG